MRGLSAGWRCGVSSQARAGDKQWQAPCVVVLDETMLGSAMTYAGSQRASMINWNP